MQQEKIYEILLKILELDQSRISVLDSIKFTIRGWSVTLASACVGFAFQQHNRVFLWIGIIGSLFFTMLDWLYRSTQLQHVERSTNIQKYLKQEYLEKFVESRNLLKPLDEYVKGWKNYLSIVLLYVPLILLLIGLLFAPIK